MSVSRITQVEKSWPLYHKKDGSTQKLLQRNSIIQMFVVAEYWFFLIGSLKFLHWFVNISDNHDFKKDCIWIPCSKILLKKVLSDNQNTSPFMDASDPLPHSQQPVMNQYCAIYLQRTP